MKYLLIIACILILFSCKKDKTKKGRVTFYQSDYLVRNTFLYLNNKGYDVLNSTYYLDSNGYTPECEDNLFPYVKTLDLDYGTYKYFVRASNKSSDTFTITVDKECQIVKVPKS